MGALFHSIFQFRRLETNLNDKGIYFRIRNFGVRSMRKSFPGHYPPSNDELLNMLKTGTIVFDTNVLLDLYKITPRNRDHLFKILESLKSRIWIPHQVGKEYQRNRLNKIEQQLASHQKLKDQISKLAHILDDFKQHPFVDHETLSFEIKKSSADLLKLMEDGIAKNLGKSDTQRAYLAVCDKLHTEITNLFEGKVGVPYEGKEREERRQLALKRYAAKIPPGYKDSGGKENADPGDGILWLQLLDKAKSEPGVYLLISGDSKEDWWFKKDKQIIAPRKELIEEMKFQTQCDFWLLEPEQFIQLIEPILGIEKNQSLVDELGALREQETASGAALTLSDRRRRLLRTKMMFKQCMKTLSQLNGGNELVNYFNVLEVIERHQTDGVISMDLAERCKHAFVLNNMAAYGDPSVVESQTLQAVLKDVLDDLKNLLKQEVENRILDDEPDESDELDLASNV